MRAVLRRPANDGRSIRGAGRVHRHVDRTVSGGARVIHYVPAWDGRGHVVARMGPTGSTVVLECPTFFSAEREAEKLNQQEQARQAAPVIRPAYYGQRRSVRYFEPDAYA